MEPDPVVPNSEIITSVGFQGTLPEGRTFGSTNLKAGNGLTGLTNVSSYLTHSLTLLDQDSKQNIVIDLPFVKFNDSQVSLQNLDLQPIARNVYSLQKVKETLSVGEKEIQTTSNSNVPDAFRVQLYDQENYIGYTSENLNTQSGDFLRVTELFEGEEVHPELGPVNFIEVIFEMEVTMFKFSEEGNVDSGKISGLLRMRFREKK
jgi:hypothetical protein